MPHVFFVLVITGLLVFIGCTAMLILKERREALAGRDNLRNVCHSLALSKCADRLQAAP